MTARVAEDVAVAGPATGAPPRRLGAAAALLGATALLVVVAAWHLTQGTSGVGAGDLLRLDDAAVDLLLGSRVPRTLAGLAIGFALGVSGALFQSLSRNALASPDTLAVNAGAYLAVVLAAVTGFTLPVLGSSAVAFGGGMLAAGLVLVMSGAGGSSTTRLVLAGSAVSLALFALTSTLLILFEEETTGLFAWGSGTLSQRGLDAVVAVAPLLVPAVVVALLLTRRLDLLAAGDDAARSLGVPVVATRVLGVVLAVLLASVAVTLAGPVGFVGLCAPALVRLVAARVPAVARHLVQLPLAGMVGALIVLGADAVLRAAIGPEASLRIPTGVTTTLLGAVVLVLLARRAPDAGPTRTPPGAGGRVATRRRTMLALALVWVLAAGAVLAGVLSGYTMLLTGDVANYLAGEAVPSVAFALDERLPRVAAAVLAGGALALAGTVVQAVCRNPLAEPGIIGITGGAGVGAVVVVTTVTTASTALLAGGALAGAMVAFLVVYLASWRGGLDSDRLVLVGVGVSAGATAITTFLLVRSNPFDTPRIFTWLAGSTYDRSWEQILPVMVVLGVGLPVVWALHSRLDLLALDEDTPRLVGVPLEALRLGLLTLAALLTAVAVSAAGVVAFVGLVAPHAARALVGARHLRVVPLATGLGVLLLSVADTIGRTAIAPAQVPAGLVVAVIGAPYFIWLLARSRA
ncbi:iron ABC transporter permease [uncultured Nocardioides sp.]|uniref:iron ABC transporter permease n=1 Tax=uncultured Nocardioides sp. TaxID=198441 RepID=UPI002626D15E|nr:iron ABC transporter permease [uncultured Nocardioides sp.]